jgi:membrane-associated phospholipid phosphatase
MASWGFMVGLMAYPVAVDVPVAWARGGGWLAWQFVWQDALVLSVATAIDIGLRDLVGRARPDVAACIANGGQDCTAQEGTQAARSFPGGHMAAATASAALICTQHLHTHLYGGPWDAAVCGSALASSVAVGVLRIVADAHNATDILAGALLGGLIGGLGPTLMWYPHHRHVPFDNAPPRAMVAPYPVVYPGGGGGLGVTGVVF